jgi:hypothetical protein
MTTKICALVSLMMLGACGGGSMSSNPASNSVAVASAGVITAFGSVYVNGVRYDVSAARLQKNGVSVMQTALAVGELAVVKGQQDQATGQGHAESVDVEDSVVGPVASIDQAANSLVVLGQTVLVTANTSFASKITPATLVGLSIGNIVEVSGLVNATGSITATRIGLAATGEALQVLGTVAGLNTASHTFMIDGLTVGMTSATLSGFTSGQPANGDAVEVQGTVFDATTMTLTATSVRLATNERSEATAGGRVEEEGLVTRFVSATDFDVNGAPVTTSATTVYKGGVVADLALNVRVEVAGTLNASNVLVADTVQISHVAVIGIESTVSAVNAMAGTLTVQGVAITVDANTRFEDRSSAQVQLFTLKDVNVGDSVEVRGYENPAGSGMVLAKRLERVPATTVVEVRGPFTAATAPQFKILGIVIDTTGATFGGVESHQTMTSTEFFAQAPGKIVDVSGTGTATVTATTVRIDSEADR